MLCSQWQSMPDKRHPITQHPYTLRLAISNSLRSPPTQKPRSNQNSKSSQENYESRSNRSGENQGAHPGHQALGPEWRWGSSGAIRDKLIEIVHSKEKNMEEGKEGEGREERYRNRKLIRNMCTGGWTYRLAGMSRTPCRGWQRAPFHSLLDLPRTQLFVLVQYNQHQVSAFTNHILETQHRKSSQGELQIRHNGSQNSQFHHCK